MIWVSPHSQLKKALDLSRAQHLVVLRNKDAAFMRPKEIAASNIHTCVMNDITEPHPGLIMPDRSHVKALLEFHRNLPDNAPILLSCYAGISRSTAAAYILACAQSDGNCEKALAVQLRARAPSATPNILLVSLADEMLGRDGRMRSAIAEIGRGMEAFEGEPFFMEADAV